MSPQKGITQGKHHLAAENSRFYIYFDELCDGDEYVPDYLVVVPKRRTSNQVTGVAILPEYQGKLGLIYIYRHPIGESGWEIPRGFLEDGEAPEAAARRELEEETGLTCKKTGLVSLGIIAPEPGVLNARTQIYLARNCSSIRPYQADELGHEEMRWFTNMELKAMVLGGELQGGVTLTSCCLYLTGQHIMQENDKGD
jgi:8-oxo-dGTP pyrophosphatase MutT (NUDIX family)